MCDSSLAQHLAADTDAHGSLDPVTAQPDVITNDAGKRTRDLCLRGVRELSGVAQIPQHNVSRARGKC